MHVPLLNIIPITLASECWHLYILHFLVRTGGWPWLILAQHFDVEGLVQYIILELSKHFVTFIPRDELALFGTVG